jgi:hypothetical protein
MPRILNQAKWQNRMEWKMTTEPAGPPRHSHSTAPTQYVEASGVRYAYRRFGTETGTPVVFLQGLHLPPKVQ